MSRFILFSVLLSMLFLFSCDKEESNPNGPCLSGTLENGLIASFTFSNGSLDNGAATGYDLLNMNNALPTTDREGNAQCAYFVSASDDSYLVVDDPFFLNDLSSFSISLWYHPMDSARTAGEYEVLIGRNVNQVFCPDRRGEWSVGLYDCRRAVFGHNNSVWANDFSDVPAGTDCHDMIHLLTGKWHHVAAVYDNDQYSIYYNGVLASSASGAAGCINQHTALDIGDLVLGRFYTGKLDDVLIYDRALSALEIADLAGADACCE